MKIRFEEDTRDITVQNYKRDVVLVGKIGLGIPLPQLPYDCSDDKLKTTHLCLLWRDSALLNIDYREEGTAKCYEIAWKSLKEDVSLRDCYDINQDDASWYGGALMADQQWPLGNQSIHLQPYIPGEAGDAMTFGPVLERYWLSSKGVALFAADHSSSLHVSWNELDAGSNKTSGDGRLCLVADNTHSVFKHTLKPALWLNYTLCSSDNIFDVHHLAVKAISTKRNISEIKYPDIGSLSKPVWSTASISGSFSENSIKEQISKIQALQAGLFIIADGWQNKVGDLRFDLERFSNVSDLVGYVKDTLKCRVALSLYPYISIQSRVFEEATLNRYLVRDAGGVVPGLFQWQSDNPATPHVTGAVDVHQNASDWFKQKLATLRNTSAVDVFSFLGGEASRLPFEGKFAEGFTNPSEYTTGMGRLASETGPFALVQSATHLQGQPVIIHVQHKVNPEDKAALQAIIPKLLTLGIMGYPFIMIDISHTTGSPTPLSKELYLRYMQLATFLPVMHFPVHPDIYGPDAVRMVKRLQNIRDTIVFPLILNATRNSAQLLNPIIRPIWWVAPSVPATYGIKDSFLVGDSLLVAPILEEGVVERDIYLPEGSWVAEDNLPYKGPGTFRFKNMSLGMDDHHHIGYFVRSSWGLYKEMPFACDKHIMCYYLPFVSVKKHSILY